MVVKKRQNYLHLLDMNLSMKKYTLFIFLYLLFLPFTDFAREFNILEFDSMCNKCTKYLDNHKNDEAFELFKMIESFEIPETNIDAKANFYVLKSSISGRKNDFDQQYKDLKIYEQYCKKLNNLERTGSVYLAYGSYYEQFSDFNNAHPFFKEALKYYKRSENELKIAYLYNKLGLIYYQEENYELAIKYFLSAFLSFRKHQFEDPVNAYWMQNTLSNVGLSYRHLNQLDKSLSYFKFALVFSSSQAFEKARPMAVIKTNIGVAYDNLGEISLAVKWLESGLKDCLNPNNNEIAHGINSLLYLTKIHRKAGNLLLANKSLEKALTLINEHRIGYLYQSYLYNLAENLNAKGNTLEAYNTFKKYNKFKDSIQNINTKLEIGKQFLTHELERKIDDNNMLEKENQISKLRQRIYLGLSFFVIAILVISVYNYRRLKLKNHELSVLNKKIIDQSENLSDLNYKLEKLNRNKSYLMQSIAHDLRAPIGNIMGLNEIMESEANNQEQIKEYFPMIHGSCMLSLNIIEDILDQSMIEKGSFDIKKSKQYIQQVIKESMDVINFKSASKNIQLVTDFHQDISFEFDTDRIKRVFINIIMNAIKFSPRGSSIIIHQSILNNYCVVQIEDQGIGMKSETIDKIFDRHTKASQAGTENEASIGIGLSITKLIVEAHGGKIHVESKPNSGSSFYIELPLS